MEDKYGIKRFTVTIVAEIPSRWKQSFGKYTLRNVGARLSCESELSVADADGDVTSFVVNLRPDSLVVIYWNEDESQQIRVDEFCAVVGCKRYHLGDLLSRGDTDKGEEVQSLAQHLYIYSR